MKRFVAAAIPLLLASMAHAAETPAPAAASAPQAQSPAAASSASAPAPAAQVPASPALDAQEPTPAPEDQPVTLDSLLNPPSKASTGLTDLRMQMLTDAGKTVGFRGGMAARARVLRDALNARAERLDTIFQFSPLINRNGTIPPVIVEARELSSFSPDQIRTANRVYKIEKEERFVSVPPTWRDYLFVGLPVKGAVDLPTFDTRPQDGKEEGVWRDAVKSGWSAGEQQTDAILAANFNRLTRDYTGMVRYSTLLQEGMISTTRVAESRQTVTGDGKQLMLGDTLRRVTSRATFETDPNKWRPTVNRGTLPVPKVAPVPQAGAAPDSKPPATQIEGRPQGDDGK
ncbi:type IV secretory system conjugative DNA transfer family protein [Burkholderia cenocepacia]|uniref:type IV secretory system conjugative DNA transfer family protein n=1 Tax=Burkholderia cenocepacia TaxID=95486 RepID=UPI002AB79356|nr:type IV secretory system conjugative DNA transfer family protein [Burkholderia cenocepacia]